MPVSFETSKASDLIVRMQEQLTKEALDGWLFYFFKGNDPIALSVLGIEQSHAFSRRWFYFVPVDGEPIKLVHRIEMDALDHLPGRLEVYLGWKELESKLADLLYKARTIAMQYSPRNAVPYLARVDAGTIELIKSLGKTVVTSANLVQCFEARWTKAQLHSHIYAVESLRKIVFEGFAQVRESISAGKGLNEYELQQFIMERFDHYGMTTYSPPIVAVNEHSGSPHYQPSKDVHSPIDRGDFLLLDIWAKDKKQSDAIYGDITWTGFVGETVPTQYVKIFDIVRGARDAALDFVRASVKSGDTIYDWQVDDVAREFIRERGYVDYFIHRTGHSIGCEVHGNGANMDNLETKEERTLISCTGFSIEPGIYLEEFGVRSEIDVYIEGEQTLVAGEPIQDKVICIMSDEY